MPPEDEQPTGAEEQADVSTSLVPTWWTLFAGYSLIATLVVLAGILAIRYLGDRPVDITRHSEGIEPEIQRALNQLMLPREGIRIHTQGHHSSNGDEWTHTQVEVEVPQRLETSGIAALLEARLEKQGMRLTREHTEGASRVLKAWLGNFEVARIAIVPAPAADVDRKDETQLTKQLIQRAFMVLETMGLPREGLFLDGEELREDREMQWTRGRIEVRAGTLPDPRELRLALLGAMKMAGVAAQEGPLASGGHGVTVKYQGRTALEVALMPAATAPRAHLAGPMNEQPDLFDVLDAAAQGGTAPPLRDDASSVELRPLGWDAWEAPGPQGAPGSIVPPGPREKSATTHPKVSIILDDGGFGGEVTERVLSLDPRLTLAILPNTPEGEATAKRARAKGFEVMLHMPMENSNPAVEDYPGEITRGMEREQMARLTLDAMAQTPGAVGVNNHTGSTFTESAEAMAGFLQVVKEKQWYFIDSRTSAASAGLDVARQMDVPAAKRDVFLDDVDEPGAIRAEWQRTLKLAREQGRAIAIGHFRPLTVALLEEELPRLAEEGIALVHASELVQ